MPEVPPLPQPSPQEISAMIQAIYELEFGGKERGRFQLSRQELRELAERARMEDTVIDGIIDAAYELGLVITDLGDSFSVVEASVMHGYRSVPARILREQRDARRTRLTRPARRASAARP